MKKIVLIALALLMVGGAIAVLRAEARGQASGLTATDYQAWHQNSSGLDAMSAEGGDEFGYTLAVGDFNGDGFEDLAIGSPREDLGEEPWWSGTIIGDLFGHSGRDDTGMVVILYGSDSGLSSNNYQLWHLNYYDPPAAEGDERVGTFLAAGDFNDDGYDDLVVSSKFATPYIEGKIAHVLFGSSGGLSLAWILEPLDFVGWEMYRFQALAVGDLNADDCDDLVLGHGNDGGGDFGDSYGRVLIVPGDRDSGFKPDDLLLLSADIVNTTLGIEEGVVGDPNNHNDFGDSLAVGDFNGDGVDDLAIGDPGADEGDNGFWAPVVGDCNYEDGGIYVFFGGSQFSSLNRGELVFAVYPHAGDRFGQFLSAGDYEGDGYDDLAVGIVKITRVMGFVTDADAKIWVLCGSPYDTYGKMLHCKAPVEQDIGALGDMYEPDDLVLASGDFNSDGYDDLAVGLPHQDDGKGKVFVAYGTTTGLPDMFSDEVWTQASTGLSGISAENDDHFGAALAAGNFGGSCSGDHLAIGSPGEDLASYDNNNEGMVIVLKGITDLTYPVITPAISGTLGNNGWYVSDVTIAWTVEEPETPESLTTSGCEPYTVDHDWYMFDWTCWATSCGGTYIYGVVVKRDATSPTTSIAPSGTEGLNGWYTSDVEVGLSAADDFPCWSNPSPLICGMGPLQSSGLAKTEYSLDSMSWNSYTAPFTISAEGTTTVYYRSTDKAGNVETTKEQIIKIDKTPPTTGISLAGTVGNNDWYTSDVSVTLGASDTASGVAATYYRLDGGDYQEGTSFTVTTEGEHTVGYYSVDNAGNVETTKEQIILIDKTPPTTGISLVGTLGENDWYVSDVEVTLTAADNENGSGLAQTEYSLDGANWNSYTAPFTISAEGTTTVYYRSTDKAGNVETTKEQIILIDKTPPTTGISLAGTVGNNDWYTSDVSVALEASDTTSGVAATYYSLEGGVYQEGTSFTVAAEGEHTVGYYAVDDAGNEEEPRSESFKIDKTPPEISIISPMDAEYEHSQTIEVAFTAVDDVSVVCRSTVFLDDQEYDPTNLIDLLYLPLGTHPLTVESENYAGLVSTQTVEFEVIATGDSLILMNDRLYEMGEIDNKGVMTSLNKKLEAAKAQIDSGRNKAAKKILEAFIKEIEAQRGKHVSDFAADVLITDAEYLIGQL